MKIKASELDLTPEEVPSLLLPYQQKWLRDSSGVKMYSKSRRIGVSWAEAADCALVASQIKGEDSYYIGYEKDMARGFVEDAADWAKAYNLAASEIDESEEVFRDEDEDKSIFIFRIYFNSGYKIEALSSKPRNLRSRQGRVVIDEAAFHDDFSGLLEAALALRIWGSHIHIISTYNGIEEPYFELEKDVLAGKFPYSRHFTTFDDALDDGLYKRICLVTGKKWSEDGQREWREGIFKEFGDKANQELLCIPSRSGGVYFPRVLIESCMKADIPVVTLECNDAFTLKPEKVRISEIDKWLKEHLQPLMEKLDPNLRSFYGMDFGRSGDLSALLPLQILPNLSRRAPFALEMRNVPFKQQEQVLFWLIDRLPRFEGGAMDARGNGQYLAEIALQRYGKRIAGIMFTESWYGENFPKYKAAFEDKKIILPADDNWLQDHRDVVITKGVPRVKEKRSKGTDGKQRHGDGAIAGCLAWFASCQEYRGIILQPDFGLQGDVIIVPDQKDLVDLGWFS